MSCRLTVGSKSGVVKNDGLRSILRDTLWVNCSTWRRIYRRNASEDHLPIIMMEKVGTPSKYIAIADPDLIECVPISSFENPRRFSPMAAAADRSLFRAVVDEICLSVLLSRMVFTEVSEEVPGYERMRRVTLAHALTGQRCLSPDLCIVTDSWRS